jgi:predicted ferric reductase
MTNKAVIGIAIIILIVSSLCSMIKDEDFQIASRVMNVIDIIILIGLLTI